MFLGIRSNLIAYNITGNLLIFNYNKNKILKNRTNLFMLCLQLKKDTSCCKSNFDDNLRLFKFVERYNYYLFVFAFFFHNFSKILGTFHDFFKL